MPETGVLLGATLSGSFTGQYTLKGINAWSSLSGTLRASHTTGSVPLASDFEAQASGGEKGYTYQWDFGDGESCPRSAIAILKQATTLSP